MDRKTIRKIAKKHGVSTAEVKLEIQKAITCTYANPQKSPENINAQNAILHKGNPPTADELIVNVVMNVNRRREDD